MATTTENQPDITYYLRLLRRSLLIIILLPALAAVVVYGITRTLPPTYEARAALLVGPSQQLAPLDSHGTPLVSIDEILRTYARLMTERPLLEQVIRDRKLAASPEALQSQIRIVPEVNTTIIDVTVDGNDRLEAQYTADTLVNDFLVSVKSLQRQEALASDPRSADSLLVVAPAAALDGPVSPQTRLDVGIGAALGLLAAIGLAVVRERLDPTPHSSTE